MSLFLYGYRDFRVGIFIFASPYISYKCILIRTLQSRPLVSKER